MLERQAPDLYEALERAKSEGLAYLGLDGKVVDSDQVAQTKIPRKGGQIGARYSGKAHDFGGLIQALMAPGGIPLGISRVRLRCVHELTAAREPVPAILAPYLRDLPVLADGGDEGSGHGVDTPVMKPKDGDEPDLDTRTYNKLLRGLCRLGERGFARWSAAGKPCGTSP